MEIALLQYPIAWADKETNLRLAEEHIAALAGKADVAVLPEMFATGFCTDHPELAETMDGDIIRRLQAAADQSGVAVVGSFICLPISNSAASNNRKKPYRHRRNRPRLSLGPHFQKRTTRGIARADALGRAIRFAGDDP